MPLFCFLYVLLYFADLMRKRIFFFLLALAFSAAVLCGCNSNRKNDLLGQWKDADSSYCSLNFTSDSAWEIKYGNGKWFSERYHRVGDTLFFKHSYRDNIIIYKLDNNTIGLMPYHDSVAMQESIDLIFVGKYLRVQR